MTSATRTYLWLGGGDDVTQLYTILIQPQSSQSMTQDTGRSVNLLVGATYCGTSNASQCSPF